MSHKKNALTISLPPGKAKTHGGFSFLATGKLPEHRKAVRAYLSAARAGLIKDLGPTEQDLTAAQIILIDRTVTALGVVRCMEEHVRENSVMKGSDLAPALQQSYLAYVNHIRLNLMALGLKTRAGEGVLDLGAYIQAKDAEKSQAKARKCLPEAVGGKAEEIGSRDHISENEKIVDPRASSGDISGEDRADIDCRSETGQDQAPEAEGIGQPEPLGEDGQGKGQ